MGSAECHSPEQSGQTRDDDGNRMAERMGEWVNGRFGMAIDSKNFYW